jgi:hypothetical protein
MKHTTLNPIMRALLVVALSVPALLGTHNASAAEDDARWEVLFDGTSTDHFRGWKQDDFPSHGWVIDDGTLHIQPNAKAGDIVTRKKYGDFDLRFQWKVSPGANSGVIYHCNEYDDVRLSFMSGPEYQILDDDKHVNGKNPKTTAASLYAHYKPNEKKQLKPVGQWNTGRVVVKDGKVEHWLNGERVLSYDRNSDEFKQVSSRTHYRQWEHFAKDDVGHIAFQDHNNAVWYRDIRIKALDDKAQKQAADDVDRADNWRVLFDGSSTKHFRGLNRDEFPEGKWTIDNGALHHTDGRGGGDIITKKKYASFDFRFEWKIAEGGNSGVKYRVGEAPPDAKNKPTSALGLEYQILDDAKHRDGNIKTHRTADLYDLIEAKDTKTVNPPGQWNTSRIVMDGDRVRHYLNGELVVEYELWSDDFNARLAKSKYRGNQSFAKTNPGHIAFQDHGDKVWYRNIRIRELSDTKPSTTD